ncbi:MAG: DNA polymerase Y family protein [Acidimicrobiia bacterium]
MVPDGPCFIYEERPSRSSGGEAQRIRAANLAAREAGVQLGMGRRAAEALCPTALSLPRDLGEETRRFEKVVLVLEGMIPRVEVVEPGLVLLPVGGAVRYYGGEWSLIERVAKELTKVVDPRHGARLGLADGPFAARWAAITAGEGPKVVEDTAAFLSTLDISTLEKEELIDTFRWLGVATLGELAGLPREAVASRFGESGLYAHRLASGEGDMVQPRSIPPHLAVEAFYDDPLETLDQVAFSARALSVRLMLGLRREGIAPHRIEITAEAANGRVRVRTWRSSDPFFESTLTERVWWQLRAWMEQEEGVPGGLVRLRLDPSDLSGEGRQLILLEAVDGAGGALGWQGYDPNRHEVERALARAQALVGPDAVLQADRQGGRMPGEQVFWHRFGEEPGFPERDPDAPWPGTTPGPIPALVPPDPIPFEIEWDEGTPHRVRLGSRWEPVLNWAGPWRLFGRWWRGEAKVDRYQLVTSAGAFLVVVSEGKAYLAGVYD